MANNAFVPSRLPRPSSQAFATTSTPYSSAVCFWIRYFAAISKLTRLAVSSPMPGANSLPPSSRKGRFSTSGNTISVWAAKTTSSSVSGPSLQITFLALSMRTFSAPCARSQSRQNAARKSSFRVGAGIFPSVRSSSSCSVRHSSA